MQELAVMGTRCFVYTCVVSYRTYYGYMLKLLPSLYIIVRYRNIDFLPRGLGPYLTDTELPTLAIAYNAIYLT